MKARASQAVPVFESQRYPAVAVLKLAVVVAFLLLETGWPIGSVATRTRAVATHCPCLSAGRALWQMPFWS
eukprot:scaffold44204_cov176-Amphora_coffeaeformis.AAC.2